MIAMTDWPTIPFPRLTTSVLRYGGATTFGAFASGAGDIALFVQQSVGSPVLTVGLYVVFFNGVMFWLARAWDRGDMDGFLNGLLVGIGALFAVHMAANYHFQDRNWYNDAGVGFPVTPILYLVLMAFFLYVKWKARSYDA